MSSLGAFHTLVKRQAAFVRLHVPLVTGPSSPLPVADIIHPAQAAIVRQGADDAKKEDGVPDQCRPDTDGVHHIAGHGDAG